MNHKLWLLGRSATVGGHVLREKITRPKARTVHDVPVSGETITPEWLTAVLCRDIPGAEVLSFENSDGSRGTSTRVAIRVEYNDKGKQAGLPTELFAKTTTAFSQRLLGGGKMIEGETRFFGTFGRSRDGGPDRLLGRRRSVVVAIHCAMEDIAATRGAVFSEPNAPIARDQIEDLVRNLARLHGTFWEHPSITVLNTPSYMLQAYLAAIDMKKRCAIGLQRAHEVVPETLHGQSERLWAGVERAVDIATNDIPPTLLHGDPHIGQTYVTGTGRMGFVDWQVVMRGGWATRFRLYRQLRVRARGPARMGSRTAGGILGRARQRRRRGPTVRRRLACVSTAVHVRLRGMGVHDRPSGISAQDAVGRDLFDAVETDHDRPGRSRFAGRPWSLTDRGSTETEPAAQWLAFRPTRSIAAHRTYSPRPTVKQCCRTAGFRYLNRFRNRPYTIDRLRPRPGYALCGARLGTETVLYQLQ